ncbi:MAG: ankyrin repeat domain-containing protein [Chthonomonadaceae bacterium]|nr:ankyrin repeat domain-containing protein [Chthonomonadaceae bacterium]
MSQCQSLILRGADPTVTIEDVTALEIFAGSFSTTLCDDPSQRAIGIALISQSAHFRAEKDRDAAFLLAARLSDLETLERCVTPGQNMNQGFKVPNTIGLSLTPLEAAIEYRQATAIKWLFDHGASAKNSPKALLYAVGQDDLKLVRTLIAHGADPNNASALSTAIYPGQGDILDALLVAGAKVSPSLLITAISLKDRALVQKLLDYKAAVNSTEETGMTPLLFAVNTKKMGMCRLLLEYGADPAQTTTLYYYASIYGGTLKAKFGTDSGAIRISRTDYLEYLASPDPRRRKGLQVEQNVSAISLAQREGNTPLMQLLTQSRFAKQK